MTNKLTVWAVNLIFLGTLLFFAINIISIEKNIKAQKIQLAAKNDAANGVFNPEVWKYKILVIVKKRVNEIDVTTHKNDIKKILFDILDGILIDYRNKLEREKANGVLGWFKNKGKKAMFKAGEFFINNLKPYIAKTITNLLENNSENIKQMINDSIEEYFAIEDIEEVKSLIAKSSDIDRQKKEVELLQSRLDKYVIWALIILILSLYINIFLFYITNGDIIQKDILLNMQLMSLLLLAIGIFTSMIEINAKILDLNFTLLGESIQFKDQILYFQRKSILDVAYILFKSNPIVAVSIVLFSIIFPLLKAVFLIISLFSNSIRNNKIVAMIIQNISKWSMADVFIVAMFLTYMGFSGILNDQLSSLSGEKSLQIFIDTNQTQLAIGFFAFLGYVILSVTIGILYKKYTFNNYQENK